MISPHLLILKGRNRGLLFKQLSPIYAKWLRDSTGDDNTRAKLLDVLIQGRFISSYTALELRELARDDLLTTFQLDAIQAHLDRPVRWSAASQLV